MEQSRPDGEWPTGEGFGHSLGRTAMKAVTVVTLAVVVGGVVAWTLVQRIRTTISKPPMDRESDYWRQQARALSRRGREVIRDLKPSIVAGDLAAQSRDMRSSWARQSAATAREISGEAAELGSQATTARAKAAIQHFSTSLARLAEAALDLAEMMDDAARVKRLTSEQKKAEESLSDLQQAI